MYDDIKYMRHDPRLAQEGYQVACRNDLQTAFALIRGVVGIIDVDDVLQGTHLDIAAELKRSEGHLSALLAVAIQRACERAEGVAA